jgi:hypothetical protein
LTPCPNRTAEVPASKRIAEAKTLADERQPQRRTLN